MNINYVIPPVCLPLKLESCLQMEANDPRLLSYTMPRWGTPYDAYRAIVARDYPLEKFQEPNVWPTTWPWKTISGYWAGAWREVVAAADEIFGSGQWQWHPTLWPAPSAEEFAALLEAVAEIEKNPEAALKKARWMTHDKGGHGAYESVHGLRIAVGRATWSISEYEPLTVEIVREKAEAFLAEFGALQEGGEP